MVLRLCEVCLVWVKEPTAQLKLLVWLLGFNLSSHAQVDENELPELLQWRLFKGQCLSHCYCFPVQVLCTFILPGAAGASLPLSWWELLEISRQPQTSSPLWWTGLVTTGASWLCTVPEAGDTSGTRSSEGCGRCQRWPCCCAMDFLSLLHVAHSCLF